MQIFLTSQFAAYRCNGIMLARRSDQSTVFFQPGDEANAFEDELEACERLRETCEDEGKARDLINATLSEYFSN